ncbi:RodZ family helix-turn-helix domain-containing protein [Streptomyces sp. MUM 16J]|uniref:helix-turn-helix domain-containing protein n=1 Tax=Streptomyces sp. MUM 16J TaxID=2791988 RepID=UPI001F04EE17|nr:helix-turn-helix transcriptional regulator [Streptomyces sp. MUM 16J]MCH0555782.1 helix-turn-helix domain-containing protein [Streptomyces sp. MUM 16J]
MMMAMTPEQDFERLGRAFAAARKAVDLSQIQVAKQLHVSRTAIQAIERGRQSNGSDFSKVTGTMRAYARLVGWTTTSPDVIADGGEPKSASKGDGAEHPPSDLPPVVERELRSGTTIDHAVVNLGDEDDDTRIIVVLKGAENMTEEEIDAAWRKWRTTRRRLQAIPGESDTSQES